MTRELREALEVLRRHAPDAGLRQAAAEALEDRGAGTTLDAGPGDVGALSDAAVLVAVPADGLGAWLAALAAGPAQRWLRLAPAEQERELAAAEALLGTNR